MPRAPLLVVLVAALLCCGAGAAVGAPRAVLFLMPSLDYLRLSGGELWLTGSYLDESMVPAGALLDAGFAVTVATPLGLKPPLDQRSNASHYFDSEADYQRALTLWDSLPSLQAPAALHDLVATNVALAQTVAHYDALFIPGGHAPMIDLWPSTDAGTLIGAFFDAGKLIAAICHGPVVLSSVALVRPNAWPFVGYDMTVFSTAAEKLNQENLWNGTALGFFPEDVLRAHGANVIEKPPYTPNVIVDRQLVTGQNPQSAVLLAATLVKMLGAGARARV